MSDASNLARSLRERFSGTTEERLGKALSDLLENPLLTGAIGRAFDAREKAVQAQEVAMGALNIPSAADIERLTRRLRSVSHRLEGIEEGVDRLEAQLETLGHKLDHAVKQPGGARAGKADAKPKAGAARPKTRTAKPARPAKH